MFHYRRCTHLFFHVIEFTVVCRRQPLHAAPFKSKISVAVEAEGYRGYLSEAKITCFAEYKRSGRGCISSALLLQKRFDAITTFVILRCTVY